MAAAAARAPYRRRAEARDLGCINLAGQIVVMVLSGMNAREARNRAPRLFRDTVALCHRLWRSFDTPEQLAARALEHMEASPADLLPPKVLKGVGRGEGLPPGEGPSPRARPEASSTLAEPHKIPVPSEKITVAERFRSGPGEGAAATPSNPQMKGASAVDADPLNLSDPSLRHNQVTAIAML